MTLPLRHLSQRYTALPLPSYRFVPGQTPHPRKDPEGHSYQQPEPDWPAFTPQSWADSTGYLYGLDLFNATLWWESHEHWEALWVAVGKKAEPGPFLRGLIQLSAAHLRHLMGTQDGAERLLLRAQTNFQALPQRYCGLIIAEVIHDSQMYLKGRKGEPTQLCITPQNP